MHDNQNSSKFIKLNFSFTKIYMLWDHQHQKFHFLYKLQLSLCTPWRRMGGRRHSSPYSWQVARWRWMVSGCPCHFHSGERHHLSNHWREAGWASDIVLTMWNRRQRLAPTDAKSHVETMGSAVRTSLQSVPVPVVAYSRARAEAVGSRCDGHDSSVTSLTSRRTRHGGIFYYC